MTPVDTLKNALRLKWEQQRQEEELARIRAEEEDSEEDPFKKPQGPNHIHVGDSFNFLKKLRSHVEKTEKNLPLLSFKTSDSIDQVRNHIMCNYTPMLSKTDLSRIKQWSYEPLAAAAQNVPSSSRQQSSQPHKRANSSEAKEFQRICKMKSKQYPSVSLFKSRMMSFEQLERVWEVQSKYMDDHLESL